MPKTKGNSIIFEECWTYKSGKRVFGLVPEMAKDGHFWQKCPYSGTKKWHFRCPNKNSFSTFISPTSPKNDGITFGFKR